MVYPVKCTCLFGDNTASRVMVMAPKRNHKRAVARNLLKRRMREAYRLHKRILEEGRGVDIALSYIAKGEPLGYQAIEKAVISILNKLCAIRDNQETAAGGHSVAK